MKLITAILWPDCLEAVRNALNPAEAQIVSAGPVWSGAISTTTFRGAAFSLSRPAYRIEVVVPNDLAVEDAVEAIKSAAADAGDPDGLLVIGPADQVVNLRTLPAAKPAR